MAEKGLRDACRDCLPRIVMDETEEIVYVSDPITYDILYLNEYGRKHLGLSHIEGGKCYEILQGFDAPCPFCTNARLTPDAFLTWEYTNPITRRHYLLKDKLIRWGGRLVRMEVAVDITEKEDISQAAQRQLRIERTLVDCIRILDREENFSQAVDMVLSNLGRLHDADRAYICEYIPQAEGPIVISNTHEWCAEGVASQKDALQNLPMDCIKMWCTAFEEHREVVIESLEAIRDSRPEEYAILKPQGVESLVVVPLLLDGAVTGFIGVDNPRQNQDDYSLLHSLAYFVTNEQKKRNMESELKRMSYHDDLTGLNNRNSYMRLLRRLEASPPPELGVVFIDLNGLKKMNDESGHAAGDAYIKDMSAAFRRHFRGDDVFRIGGDEFVFLCPRIPAELFYAKIEAMRQDVGRLYPDALALGSVWKSGNFEVMDMVKQADRLMYGDKKAHQARRAVDRGDLFSLRRR